MVSATSTIPGSTVRDKHLGLLWVVIANEAGGDIEIERNGVLVSASIWDVELEVERPSQDRSP